MAIVGTLHVVAAVYLVRRHQSGAEGAFHSITNHASLRPRHGLESSKINLEVHALAPCHAFPGPSFLHSHRSVDAYYVYILYDLFGLISNITYTLYQLFSIHMTLRYPDCSPNNSVATESINFTKSPIGNNEVISYEHLIVVVYILFLFIRLL